MMEGQMSWVGDNPYCVVIARGPDDSVIIDLDKHGWAQTYADWIRSPARWFLVRKSDMLPVLWMRVQDGEQPYYSCRHTGFTTGGNGTETLSFGIGKKRLDGHVDRIWILPNGAITLGDDVDEFALDLLKGGR